MDRIFESFPPDQICPICKTNKDEKCCLIPIDGTTNESICEAEIFHVSCVYQLSKFRFNKRLNLIYYNFESHG